MELIKEGLVLGYLKTLQAPAGSCVLLISEAIVSINISLQH